MSLLKKVSIKNIISEKKKVNSLVINTLLASSDNTDQPIKICPPKSLAKWKIKHGLGDKKENQETSKCDVKIPEPKKR